MRRIGHLNFTYIRNRCNQWLYQKRSPLDPWLTEDMNRILSTWLKPGDIGFEWGAGRSTLWFASKVKHITAVEQNPVWAIKVEEMINSSKFGSKIKLEKHFSIEGITPDSYCEAISKVNDKSLDFCLVDGDLRDKCATSALPKIKPGGIIIVDNVERYIPRESPSKAPNALDMRSGYSSDLWRSFSELTTEWRCIWTSDGVSDTALWVCPVA